MAQKSHNIFTLLSDDEEPRPAGPPKNQRKAPAKVQPNIREPHVAPKEDHQKPEPKKAPAVMDRKSRTGRSNQIKKGGAGAHNWGVGTEIEAEEDAKSEEAQEPAEAQESIITMSEWLGLGSTEESHEPKKDPLVKFRFGDAQRGQRGNRRGGRGGRGGREEREERGGAHRGEEPRKPQVLPDLQDTAHFPGLS